MAFMNNSEQILEVFGVIVLFMMYLAPVSSFVDMCKKKSTEGYQWAPHVISLFNTTFVLYYAILKDDRRHVLDVILISTKALGVLIQATCVIIFISLSPKSCQVSRIFHVLLSTAVIAGSISGLTLLIHGVHERLMFVGWLSAAFSICGFGLSSYNMIQAVMTKDAASISWLSSIISTMNAIIWLWNGLLVKDVLMATPNAIGIFVGASQIICYILCKKKGANDVETNPTWVIESSLAI